MNKKAWNDTTEIEEQTKLLRRSDKKTIFDTYFYDKNKLMPQRKSTVTRENQLEQAQGNTQDFRKGLQDTSDAGSATNLAGYTQMDATTDITNTGDGIKKHGKDQQNTQFAYGTSSGSKH